MIRGSASWVRESVQTLAGMVVDNAPLAFTLFVWLHVIPFSYATVMAGSMCVIAALFVFTLWCAPGPFHPARCAVAHPSHGESGPRAFSAHSLVTSRATAPTPAS